MTSGPGLVLMPGLDGSGQLFTPLIDALPPGLNLTIVRYPNLDNFAEYLDCAHEQLPSSPGYSLVAESFSGPIALALLAQNGIAIGPSVLSASFARSPLRILTRMAKFLPGALFRSPRLGKLGLDLFAAHGPESSNARAQSLNLMQVLSGDVLQRRISLISRIDVTELLPRVAQPILYLRATRDRLVAARHGRLLLRNLPNASGKDIDGPHLLLQTRPRICAKLICEHLSIPFEA